MPGSRILQVPEDKTGIAHYVVLEDQGNPARPFVIEVIGIGCLMVVGDIGDDYVALPVVQVGQCRHLGIET